MRSAVTLLLLICAQTAVAAEEFATPNQGRITSEYGCTLNYEHYQPDQEKAFSSVILAHGFMRSLKSMRGWARHWQTQGIATVIVSFCNSSIFNGRHQRNADDLIALRKHLTLAKVVYAGFSAGGLAAYLAALKDDGASAYLGLDAVDSGRLAKTADHPLQVPSFFLLAGPSSCNAKNNMLPTIIRHDYPMLRLEAATHCHFESPYDKRCSWLCGRSTAAQTATIQATIMHRATSWLKATAHLTTD